MIFCKLNKVPCQVSKRGPGSHGMGRVQWWGDPTCVVRAEAALRKTAGVDECRQETLRAGGSCLPVMMGENWALRSRQAAFLASSLRVITPRFVCSSNPTVLRLPTQVVFSCKRYEVFSREGCSLKPLHRRICPYSGKNVIRDKKRQGTMTVPKFVIL